MIFESFPKEVEEKKRRIVVVVVVVMGGMVVVVNGGRLELLWVLFFFESFENFQMW
jgi:hypothetical protein